MAKVALVNERTPEWFRKQSVPLRAALPYYQRDGDGYVHRVRSGHLHYSIRTGEHTHTSVHFWCGATGFLYPAGKQNPKHRPAVITASPSPTRTICATCEGRAIGAGQVPGRAADGRVLQYRPHSGFFRLPEPTHAHD